MELLKKYFGEHYPDEPMFLRNLNKISPVHGQVQDLCNRYCITQNIDTLQKLYFVAKIVRLRSKHVTPKHEIKTQIEYKRELYSLFLYILKRRNNTSIDKPIFKTIVAKEYNRSHTLTDGLILSQFEDFIFDTVAELHTGKRWNQLNLRKILLLHLNHHRNKQQLQQKNRIKPKNNKKMNLHRT